MVVEGLDWHWETNKIVSCSHDRQAFVWSLDEDGKKWKSGLVVLKTPLAAISAKWSPDGECKICISRAEVFRNNAIA